MTTKAMHAPTPAAETPVEGCWRLIGLANHAAALGIEVPSVQWSRGWRDGRIAVQLSTREDVDRLAAEIGGCETRWGEPIPADSILPARRLYYRTAPRVELFTTVPEVVEVES